MIRRHRCWWVLVCIILLILSAATWGCAKPPAPTPVPPAPPVVPPEEVVRIVEPLEAAIMPGEITVTGTFSELPPYSNIWLIIVPPNYRFYPQWPSPSLFAIGDRTMWEGLAWIGQPEEAGMQFSIFAVAADAEANRFFYEYVRQCEDTGEWPGLTSLPTGANVYYDIVTVTRGQDFPSALKPIMKD